MSIDLSSFIVLSVFSIVSRGVVRIFSEVRTILQIAVYCVNPTPNPRPSPKKTLIWGLVASVRVFFCIWNDISNLWNTFSGVWVHWLIDVNHLSCNKAYHAIRLHTFPDSLLYFVTGFVLSFWSRCSAWIRAEKVPIWSSLYRFWIRNPK